MSVSIKKNGVVSAGGVLGDSVVCNENLVLNGDASEFGGTYSSGATYHWVNWGSATDRSIVQAYDRYWFHCKAPASSTYGGFYQDHSVNGDIRIKPNTTYTVSAIWYASADCNCRFWFHMRSSEGGGNLSQPSTNLAVKTYPQRLSYTFNSGSNASYTIDRFSLMMGPCYTTEGTDVYFTEVKLEEGSAVTPFYPYEAGENLMLNSLGDNLTGYGKAGSGWEITTKNGYKCIHVSGEIGVGKSLNYLYNRPLGQSLYVHGNDVITMSGFIMMENVTFGTTNAYVTFYGSGRTVDGYWRGCTSIADSGNFFVPSWKCFNPDKCKDWTYFYDVLKFNSPIDVGTVYPKLYARDFSGDLYARNLKVEYGSKPTPWTPSPKDDIYLSSSVPFAEMDGIEHASFGKDYITSKNFYEL